MIKNRDATLVWMLICVMSAVLQASCFEAGGPAQNSRCSREGVLNRLGAAIEGGNASLIRDDLLASSDVMPVSQNGTASSKESARAFDAQAVNDATMMINAIRHRLRDPHFKHSEVGQIRSWRIEGTNVRLDADEGSSLIFEDDGRATRIPIERIVRVRSCWKIETVGYGVIDGVTSHRSTVNLTPSFARVTRAQLCTGLVVYGKPKASEELGELIEQYARYRDSHTGQIFSAVLLKTHVNGEIKGRWERLERIFDYYYRTNDEALATCRWSVRDEEVTADPAEEIPPR